MKDPAFLAMVRQFGMWIFVGVGLGLLAGMIAALIMLVLIPILSM